jgi:hypothetical protein
MEKIIRNAAIAANAPYPLDSGAAEISEQILSSLKYGESVAGAAPPPKKDIHKFLENLQSKADAV